MSRGSRITARCPTANRSCQKPIRRAPIGAPPEPMGAPTEPPVRSRMDVSLIGVATPASLAVS